MRCPFCQYTENRVLESRSAEGGQSVRRRRECLRCKRRFTTYERIEFVPITVIKRNGDRESFDRSKLLRGIIRACEKTDISAPQLEAMVDEIEAELQQRAVREVSSSEIGELVLQNLCDLSEVAYIRFASVYRKFQGIRDFVDALNHLQSTSSRSSSKETLAQEESPVGSDRTILPHSQPASHAEV
ncbi:transcriptional regulator NrdR [Leptothermofonsia sp. ETS-13]|uniref:transcriptional regulator NrdR n=1 Tax=Leptothermofonsia sp. ETS-13 TaxID=3035696 RepID=UPI003B9F79C6